MLNLPLARGGSGSSGLPLTGGTLSGSLLFSAGSIGADGANRPVDIRASGKIFAGDGAANAPSIGFDSDEDNGLYLQGVNSVGIATAGTGRWFVNASGHLLAITDASFDIGASLANRPRNAFLQGALTFGALAAVWQTRGAPNRATLELASGNFASVTGNLTAGTTGTDADVALGAIQTRSAGWVVRMGITMTSGASGTRLWGLMFNGRMMFAIPPSAPTDSDIQNSEMTFYFDDATPALKARIKKADGTSYTWTSANGASPTLVDD